VEAVSADRNPEATPREPRQRWRIVFRRTVDSPPIPSRDAAAAWEAAVLASGLPVLVAGTNPPRPRLLFASLLPANASGEAEMADLILVERLPVAEVRERLAPRLPAGHELIDLYDVWLGAPALPGLVVAADWRIELADPPNQPALAAACDGLLAAESLPRERQRGGMPSIYDLRPLLDDVAVVAGTSDTLRLRTRVHPERGVGRPDEVVAALGERLGTPLTVQTLVRERLVLGTDR
jgi:radical SAM-linked protein